ncbi:MAG: hypothetical protein JXR13_19920 [Thalassovita sp.]
MKVLALDIATQTGVAVGNSGDAPKAWSVDLGKGHSEDVRFSEVLKLTHGLIATHKPELIAIEAPIGGNNANAYLIGLAACVRGCAANRGVVCIHVLPASVRKHFLGKAKTSRDFPGLKQSKAKLAIKREVLARCHLLKWDVPDLDAADAAATWDWACANHARQYQAAPLGGLFHG